MPAHLGHPRGDALTEMAHSRCFFKPFTFPGHTFRDVLRLQKGRRHAESPSARSLRVIHLINQAIPPIMIMSTIDLLSLHAPACFRIAVRCGGLINQQTGPTCWRGHSYTKADALCEPASAFIVWHWGYYEVNFF